MSGPLPVRPIEDMDPLAPTWSTTIRRTQAVRMALGQTDPGERGSPQETRFTKVPYDPTQSDLVRHVLLFRAFHGFWGARNVALVEFTTASGETMIAIATSSSASTHSEAKLLLFLEDLQRSGQLASVSRVYSERQPCNGLDAGHNCDCLLRSSPLMAGAQLTYSYDYTLETAPSGERADETRTKEDAQFKTEREAHRTTANNEGWHAQARQEHGASVVHILPGTSAEFEQGLDDREGRTLDRRLSPFEVVMPAQLVDDEGAPVTHVVPLTPAERSSEDYDPLDVRADPGETPMPDRQHQDSARAFPASDLAEGRPDPARLQGDGTPIPPPPPPPQAKP